MPTLRDLACLCAPSVVTALVVTASPASAAADKTAELVPLAATGRTGCVPSQAAPHFVFTKGPGDRTTDGELVLWTSVAGCRTAVRGQAGSGAEGVTNDCLRAKGALPDGGYPVWRYYDKQWGHPVVRGRVWHISDAACSTGAIVRKDLFIHSNGPETTAWNDRYTSWGCIKTSQDTRASMAQLYGRSVNSRNATVSVQPAR